MGAGMIDQNLAHQLCRYSKELRPALPGYRLINQSQVRLVNQRRRLERVLLPLVPHVALRDAVQFSMYDGGQLLERGLIAILPVNEELCDFVSPGHSLPDQILSAL